jgi:phosphoribosylaminoimidazole-succinocarboxamide synthase
MPQDHRMEVLLETNIAELPLVARDDVRDIYDLPQDKQLIVYTDRMEVDGVPLDAPLPFKGLILNQINGYWMNRFSHMVGNYVVTQKTGTYLQQLKPYASQLQGRSIIIQKLRMLPLLFRMIGNLTGEEWSEYKATGCVQGRRLPKGLREAERLEKPLMLICAAGDLSLEGIDDISKWAQRMFGQKLYGNLEDICLSIFGVARNYALARGIMIADTMFEFGLTGGNPCLVNEVMTPDSSTYWPGTNFEPGPLQPSFEKQFLHEWLGEEGWNTALPIPPVPRDVMNKTVQRYRELYDVMTGKMPPLRKDAENREEAENGEG